MKDAAVIVIGAGLATGLALAVLRSQHPARVAARTVGELSLQDIADHARVVAERDANWTAQRKEWERRLEAHLVECRRRWIAAGWQPHEERDGLRLVYTQPGVGR